MQIKEQQHGAVTIISPQGALCMADAESFQTGAEQLMARTMGRFVLDLSAIPYVDSRGLEAMVAITESLAQSGRILKVCGTCETVLEILQLTGLSPMFEHFEDVNSAVRSFL